MFGSEKPKMTKPPTLTLTDLLKKLDLAEYEAKFNAAGIYDARAPRRKRPRARARARPPAAPLARSRRRAPPRPQVPTLARLTDDQLDGFDMRKLEKRKLLHHLQGVAKAEDDTVLC